MLYYYLAESYTELDRLTYLIKKLEIADAPLTELMNDTFLKNEISRIKTRASVDILLFGSYSGIYFYQNITDINRLILQLLELLNGLPELCVMDEKERYLYKYGMLVKEKLADLSVFFSELKETHAATDE